MPQFTFPNTRFGFKMFRRMLRRNGWSKRGSGKVSGGPGSCEIMEVECPNGVWFRAIFV
jgi:hypothetical protein